MSTMQLLHYLRSQNIVVWTDGSRLRYDAPEGGLTPGVEAELAEREEEILAFLRRIGTQPPPMRPVSRDGTLPLSFAQERLWFLDQLLPGSPLYNIPVALRLSGALAVEALARSLNQIVSRHESLRTTIVAVDGEPFQFVEPKASASLPTIDLSDLPQSEREARARWLVEEEARRPFDLAHGPLLRAGLLRLDEEDHVLLLTMHHIVSDEWSSGIFYRELATLYEAFSSGRPSPLPELPIQYADFAIWQRDWLQGEVLEGQLSYWMEQLADAPALLELPTDRPRRAEQTYRGARESLRLPGGLSEQLRALGRGEGATPFMTFLAAFQVLLHRYTGQEDILVGTPIANRNRAEIEGLIGFFVNTLVVRGKLSGNPTFREFLGQMREACVGAYEHQDLPFERLVQELQPERSMSRSPVFQVMFVHQGRPGRALELPGLTVRRMGVGSGTAKFDLGLSVVEGPAGLRVSIGYKSDLFDAQTMRWMLGHYGRLLEGIANNPDQGVSTLPLLTEAEQHQVVVGWNDTRADYPDRLCLHQLFEAQAERTPEKAALVFEDRMLTYRELNERANQLAHYLRRRGVGPEVHVGLCMARSLEAVIAILGILKAGAAWVPLDPTYPRARLEFVIRDSGLELVVGQPGLVELIRSAGALHCVPLDVDDLAREIACQSSRNVQVEGLSPDNLAYVIYTSGSTGRPKGVTVPHRGLVNYLWYRVFELVGEDELRATIAHYAFSFDASVGQVFEALLAGGRVCMARDAADVGGLLRLHPVTYFTATPSMLDALIEETAIPDCVVTIGVGGESVSDQLVQRVRGGTPVRRMINAYGPTEASIACTLDVLFDRRLEVQSSGSGMPAEPYEGPVTIGRPIPNVRAYILDANLQPVPVGVPGELHIGGIGLARGYLNQPGLTAERFIPDPFGTQEGERLYKTGDLARYLPDGRIVCLGRLDHQVKVRGFRVELGSIETALAAYEAVEQAIVVAWGQEGGGASTPDMDRHLVAYVVPATQPPPSVTDLRRYLSEKLPGYMVPSRYVMLTAMPLTSTGKVDRQALPPPDQTRPELDEDFAPPRTPLESTMAQVWQEVLGVDRVGVYDNFFDLGGHSLLAMRVIYRLQEEVGLEFGPGDLIFQTLGQLASAGEMRMHPSQRSQPIGFLQKVCRVIKTTISPGGRHRE